MPRLILPARYNAAPSQQTPFDPSYPGIKPQFGYIGGGNTIGGRVPSGIAAGQAIPTNGKRGRGSLFKASAAAPATAVAPNWGALTALSWLCVFDLAAQPSAIMDLLKTDLSCNIQTQAAGSIKWSLWPSAVVKGNTTGVIGAGFHACVFTWCTAEAAMRIYFDGVLQTLTPNGSGVLSNANAAPANVLSFGGTTTTSESFTGGVYYFAVPFFRSIPDNEARALCANPWQVFGSTRRLTISGSGAGPAAVLGQSLLLLNIGN